MKSLLLLGVGNPLCGDDGIGIAALQRLQQRQLPQHIRLMDAGTRGFDLIYVMQEYQRVLIIDALQTAGKPGEIKQFTLDNAQLAPACQPLSLHGFNLNSLLQLAHALQETLPPIDVIGMIVQACTPGTGLSQVCAANLDPLLQQIDHYILGESS